MHGHVSHEHFLASIGSFLGWYYICLAAMNGIAAYYCWHRLHRNGLALVLLVVSAGFVVLAPVAFFGDPVLMGFISVPGLAETDWSTSRFRGRRSTRGGPCCVMMIMYVFRKFFAQPIVAWFLFIGSLLRDGTLDDR